MDPNRKTMIITGASDGIGAAAARRLSAHGHQVVIVGRSLRKTEAVARGIGADFYVTDFTSLIDVRRLADTLLHRYPRIDILANNAGGIFGRDRHITPDGHEITFQVNYLAGFLLTKQLMPRLIESKATVICTSGIGKNAFGNIDITDLENEMRYSATKAYYGSKLAQILFVRELHRRYQLRGLASASFHPGNVASNFSGEPESALRILYQPPLRHLWLATPEEGADTLVFLAEGQPDVDFQSGECFFRRKVVKPDQQAIDVELAYALWERSEYLVKDI